MITKDEAAKVSSMLFHARDVLHLCHLREKGIGSYAAHIALGDLYPALESAGDLLTEMIAGYIGIYDFKIPASEWTDKIAFCRLLRIRMIDCQKSLSSMPDVLNKFQDVIGTVTHTIYKLENQQ